MPPAGRVCLERLGNLLGREVGRKERVVGQFAALAQRPGPERHVPAVHLKRVAAAAIELLCHDQAVKPRLLPRCRVVDELRWRRLSHQAEHKGHDGLTLGVVKRELRHPIPLVVGLIFCLLVVVAAGGPQLLPQETFPLVTEEFLEEIAGVGVNSRGIDMHVFAASHIRQFRRKR